MKKTLTIILCLALAQCGLSPAWAEDVIVPDVAPDYAKGGPADMEFVTANAGSDLAMLYHVPSNSDTPLLATPAAGGAAPITLQAGTGAETRLGVDIAAADKATDGWPWYGKAAVVVGCVALTVVAAWAIVETTQHGEHTSGDDSSTHYNIGVGGEGNSLHVRIDSPDTSRTGGY